MSRPLVIAIDGPAASGKSTLGYHLARHLDYLYLDTGALYRAVTLAALRRGIPIEDEARITALAESLPIEVLPADGREGRQYTVLMEGEDVTGALRTPEVDHAVSPVSAYPGVRAALTQRMREIARRGGVVMVGRDIGTVVLPDADLKLYLIASLDARAQRRFLDRLAQGKDVSLEEVRADLARRDAMDSSRKAAPLRPADDAIIFDNTTLTIEEMFREAERLVRDEDC